MEVNAILIDSETAGRRITLVQSIPAFVDSYIKFGGLMGPLFLCKRGVLINSTLGHTRVDVGEYDTIVIVYHQKALK